MIHRVNSINIRIPTAFVVVVVVVVVEMKQTILRFIWDCKRLQMGEK